MTVDIYPATMTGNNIDHADDWNEDSTLNLANGNFAALFDALGIDQFAATPGHMKLKTFEMALTLNESNITNPYYVEKLKKICAVAHIKKAPFIAFA